MDFVYTTCEAGKRRSVNHTRVRARSPSRAEALGVGEARPAGRAVRVRGATGRDVTYWCGAVRRDVLRLENILLLKALEHRQ